MASGAKYHNNPANRAKRRILFDVNSIKEETEEIKFQKGLYFNFNVDDVFDCRYQMLIVGPEDSPYVGGFYVFDGQFPDNYPYYPMTMKTRTQGGGIRKHPNLYTGGKCCFSFLGTWQGPPWTACQNPDTVGVSMRSVLTNNPIVNEPGWEKRNDAKTELYENIIFYFNIRYAVVEFMNQLINEKGVGNEFKFFRDIVFKHFIHNYDKGFYKSCIDKVKGYHGKKIQSPVYGFSVDFDVKYTEENIELINKYIRKFMKENGIKSTKVMEQTCVEDSEIQINSNEEISNESSKDSDNSSVSSTSTSSTVKSKKLKIKKKYTRKAPKEHAKNYDIGFKMKNEKGEEYEVRAMKNGVKRWFKV